MFNLMSKDLIVVDYKENLNNIALIMKKYDIGFILVSNKNKIIGVLTDRDIVVKILANNDFKINGYLSKPIYIDIKSSINDALKLMSDKKIKRLIVVDDKKVVGVISISDLLNSNYDILSKIKNIFEINKNIETNNVKVFDFYL